VSLIIIDTLERVFELPLSFASQYISDQIELETHFDNERINTERIRNHVLNEAPKHLKGGVAYVPAVHGDFCTPRLLVMEYIDGAVRMTDVDGLENRLHLNVNEVMNSVCEVFAAQVFRWGFINADPHPSNVLIRRHPDKPTTHQVVLIDHGLSISLPPVFREQYLTLWQYLFKNDVEGVKAICKDWGIDIGTDAMAAQLMGSAVLLQGWSGSGRRLGKDVRRHRLHEAKSSGITDAQDTTGQILTKGEKQKKDLETQRAMKATVKRFLENYELIPKACPLLYASLNQLNLNRSSSS
jgi:aarF domain-containing kinase